MRLVAIGELLLGLRSQANTRLATGVQYTEHFAYCLLNLMVNHLMVGDCPPPGQLFSALGESFLHVFFTIATISQP
jgi:hypothetical protein